MLRARNRIPPFYNAYCCNLTACCCAFMRTASSHFRCRGERPGARRLVLLGVTTIGLLALIRGGSKMHRKTADAPQTAGHVPHGARWYDLFSRVISFGRDKAIREKLIELAAPAPGEKVLDVGCGTGTLALALKSSVGTGEVHGIDASPEMIDVAKEKAARAGSAIDFQVALIEAIPFHAATFDLVTSSLMLHHLPDDLKRAGLAELRRGLKPGGRFLAMDFAAHGHSPFGPGRPLGHLL